MDNTNPFMVVKLKYKTFETGRFSVFNPLWTHLASKVAKDARRT
jgi:hypothetical protein